MSKFTIYEDESKHKDQRWRWRLQDNNHKLIARSEEAFLKTSVIESIKKIQNLVTPATSTYKEEESKGVDKSNYRFEYKQSDKDNQWYWRLKSGGNHELMAVGGEGFSTEDSVKRSILNVQEEMQRAGVEWEVPSENPTYGQEEAEKQTPIKGVPGSWGKN